MGGLFSSYKDKPDEYNPTNAEIQKYQELIRQANEAKDKADAEAARSKDQAQAAAQRVLDAMNGQAEAQRLEAEAKAREADILAREKQARKDAEQAQLDADLAKARGDESEKHQKEAEEKAQEAKRLEEQAKQAALDAQNREVEANARVLETQKRVEEAQKAADEAQEREEQVKNDLKQAQFFLEKGIQPEIWPTEEEFQSAKTRIQYDPEKLHFAVCGSSGSGKSSLVNAFRGLKNNNSRAAHTGIIETTMAITRYPDPRNEIPYKRFVWFDCPGAGTLEIPGWQYFNQQGLFIFDVIVLVYDSVILSINYI